MVDVPLAPGAVTSTAVPLTVKLGDTAGATTVISTFVASVRAPDVPVTVAVYDPKLVPPEVLIVTVSVTGVAPATDAACAAEQVGRVVAPAGPEVTVHASATVPVKPLFGVTIIVAVAEPPWISVTCCEAAIENVCGG
jgi:hypothetical protein